MFASPDLRCSLRICTDALGQAAGQARDLLLGAVEFGGKAAEAGGKSAGHSMT
jgi:hypothetical protein